MIKLYTKSLHFFPAFFAHPLQIFPAFFAAPYHTPDNPQIHNPVNILCGAYPPPALDIISYIWGHGAWYVVLPPPPMCPSLHEYIHMCSPYKVGRAGCQSLGVYKLYTGLSIGCQFSFMEKTHETISKYIFFFVQDLWGSGEAETTRKKKRRVRKDKQ